MAAVGEGQVRTPAAAEPAGSSASAHTDGRTDRQTHRQPGLPGLRARAQSPVSITLGAPPTRNPPGSWANCHPVGVGERSGRELGCRHGDDGLGAPPCLPVSHRGSRPRPLSVTEAPGPAPCQLRERAWRQDGGAASHRQRPEPPPRVPLPPRGHCLGAGLSDRTRHGVGQTVTASGRATWARPRARGPRTRRSARLCGRLGPPSPK